MTQGQKPIHDRLYANISSDTRRIIFHRKPKTVYIFRPSIVLDPTGAGIHVLDSLHGLRAGAAIRTTITTVLPHDAKEVSR